MKIPPQNNDAEVAVLGGLLLKDSAFFELEDLKVDAFYKEAHRHIYEGITELHTNREPVDILTLSNHLSKKGVIAQVGGAAYLAEILNEVPTAANIQAYAEIIKQKALRRKVINVATNIIEKAYNEDDEIKDFLDYAEGSIFEATQTSNKTSFVPIQDSIKKTFKYIEALFDKDEELIGVPSGYIDIDKVTAGFHKSNLIIIAARPGMGKTAIGLNIALRAAKQHGTKVAIFSIEMSEEELTMRFLAAESRIESQRLQTGKLVETDWPRMTKAAAVLSEANIMVDCSCPLTILDMRSKLRRLQMSQGFDLVIVDYLQFMKSHKKHNNSYEEVKEISMGLKEIAKEFNVPVIALAQCSRQCDSRDDKRPMLSDLKESGSIEQDADLVAFLYRDVEYNPDTTDKDIAEFIIRKNRHGEKKTVKLYFNSKFTAFDDLAR